MPTMDVQFRNPFYHGSLGLLGAAGNEDTVYVLDNNEVLPRGAVIIDGVSHDRKSNEHRATSAQIAQKEAEAATEVDDEEEMNAAPLKRVRPREGKVKGDNIPKTRKR
jgi:hypothetical protein